MGAQCAPSLNSHSLLAQYIYTIVAHSRTHTIKSLSTLSQAPRKGAEGEETREEEMGPPPAVEQALERMEVEDKTGPDPKSTLLRYRDTYSDVPGYILLSQITTVEGSKSGSTLSKSTRRWSLRPLRRAPRTYRVCPPFPPRVSQGEGRRALGLDTISTASARSLPRPIKRSSSTVVSTAHAHSRCKLGASTSHNGRLPAMALRQLRMQQRLVS